MAAVLGMGFGWPRWWVPFLLLSPTRISLVICNIFVHRIEALSGRGFEKGSAWVLPFPAKEVDACLADIDIRGAKPTH